MAILALIGLGAYPTFTIVVLAALVLVIAALVYANPPEPLQVSFE